MNNLSPQEIRIARLLLGLSQEEFSRALGFSGKKQVVNRWESGARKPSQLTIDKIYKLFRQRFKEIEEEKQREKQRDEIYNLIEETGDAIESLLLNNNIVYNKIKSLMSASVYFEFEVGGVDKKIRISDHEARYTYNILNGYSNFNIAVGYESGECNFSLFESEEIEEVTSILNEIYFNK